MKKTEIIKSIREQLDPKLEIYGFRYSAKSNNYVKLDLSTGIYFTIDLLLLDFASVGDKDSKYVEIYVNVFHSEISDILLQTSYRAFLSSIFYFKLLGNMLSDIILNPVIEEYSSRNNHNYFKLRYSNNSNVRDTSLAVWKTVEQYVLPFFERYDSLEKITIALDRTYDKCLSIHNVNNERLRALATLLFYANDLHIKDKLEKIELHIASTNITSALEEFKNLTERLRIRTNTV